MGNTINKYITALNHADKILLILSGTSNGLSLRSFTTVV